MAKVRVAVLGTVGKSVIVDTELNTRVSALESAVNALTQRAVGAGSKNRHGDLSGLQNDDHPQYTMWQAAEKITGQWQWTRQLWGPDGSAAAPSFSFTSDPDTGWYRVGANNPGIAVGGVKTWDLNSTRSLQIVPMTVAMTVADNVTQSLIYASATNPGGTDIDVFEVSAPMTSGTSSAGMRMAMWDVYPGGAGARGFRWDETQTGSTAAALAFYVHHNSDAGSLVYTANGDRAQLLFTGGSSSIPPVAIGGNNEGFFWDSGNSRLGVTLAGTYSFSFGSDAFRSNYPIVAGAGTASFPGYTFAADPNTGMYDFAADQLGFAVGGTTTLIIKTTAFTASQPWQGQDGTAAAPAFSFSADTNTGIYRSGADTLNLVTGGSTRFQVGASGQLGVGGATYGTSGYPLLSQGSGAAPQWAQLGLAGLDQSIAPTWTSAHVFTSTVTIGNAARAGGSALDITSTGTSAGFEFQTTGSPADEKYWVNQSNASSYLIYAVNDARSVGRGAWSASRSGVAITSLVYGNATDNPSHTFYGTATISYSSDSQLSLDASGQYTSLYWKHGGTIEGQAYLDHTNTRFVVGGAASGIKTRLTVGTSTILLDTTVTGNVLNTVSYGNSTDNPPHTFYGDILAQSLVRLKNYTVATLPAGTQGDTAYVTDALAPTFLAAVVGGGAVVTPVFYDGSNWVAH